MLKGYLRRVIYHQVYWYTNVKPFELFPLRSDAATASLRDMMEFGPHHQSERGGHIETLRCQVWVKVVGCGV